MTDPNPLREDEVRTVAFAMAIEDQRNPFMTSADERTRYHNLARAAITALDQVRENRAASPQQQAYEAQSALGIAPLPGYPVDQIRSNR